MNIFNVIDRTDDSDEKYPSVDGSVAVDRAVMTELREKGYRRALRRLRPPFWQRVGRGACYKGDRDLERRNDMTDSREIFSGKEQQYDKNRPHYPARLIDFLYDEVGFCADSVIADIGSGTGIFSKQLAERGSTVICVEPSAAMRSVAQAKLAQYPHVRFTDGDCENTELAERSVDFITAAQAFHWFDVEKFRAESRRILKPNGKSVLVWNRRDEASAVNHRTAEVLKRYCPDFHGYGGGMKDEENIERYFGGRFERFECENDLVYDREGFIGRNLSGAYAPRKEDDLYEPLVRALGEIFDEFASDGRLTVSHKTAAYWGVV